LASTSSARSRNASLHRTSRPAGRRALHEHYFLIAKDVGDLTAIVCAELEDSQAKTVPVLSRMMPSSAGQRKKIAGTEDFIADTTASR